MSNEGYTLAFRLLPKYNKNCFGGKPVSI